MKQSPSFQPKPRLKTSTSADRFASEEPDFVFVLLPILALLGIIGYGLIIRPHLLQQPAFPLEIVFILAAIVAVAELTWLGFGWETIQQSIVQKIARAMPAFMILLSIGLIIGSWMVSGTIPMLVYYGLKTIHPNYIYLLAFWIPIVFSTLTGTSWGSVGSIGIVLIGIAGAMGAHMGITAGAIVGGAYFGDKLSPLSDTTNMAALATDVDLFDHIHSMLYTTLPSAILASVLYWILGFIYPPAILTADIGEVEPFLRALETMFHFNLLLLLPPLIVLYGSLRRKPTVPTLAVSMLSAGILALLFQDFSLADVLQSMYKGFRVEMATWMSDVPERVVTLVNRGGLYALVEAVIIALTVFMFIGTIDLIDAMPRVVNRVFRFARRRAGTILSTLAAAALTNSLTSNQYATSFIVGDAFKRKYDDLGIPRKVLSRSLEDTGTMLESLVPWHPSAVFMVMTLGIPFQDYWHWQFLSLINFIVAPTLAILGIGCFYSNSPKRPEKSK